MDNRSSKTVNPNAETWEECVRLRAEVVKLDRNLEEVMTERDRAEDYADQLAQCISEMTGAQIGEHSNLNCPWEEAIEACAAFIADKRAAHETKPRLSPVPDDTCAKALTELVRLKDIKEAWESVPRIFSPQDPRIAQFNEAENAYFGDYRPNVTKAWEAARAATRPAAKATAVRNSIAPNKQCPECKGFFWLDKFDGHHCRPVKTSDGRHAAVTHSSVQTICEKCGEPIGHANHTFDAHEVLAGKIEPASDVTVCDCDHSSAYKCRNSTNDDICHCICHGAIQPSAPRNEQ